MTDRSKQQITWYLHKQINLCLWLYSVYWYSIGKVAEKHNLDLVAILTLFEALRFEPLVNEAEI